MDEWLEVGKKQHDLSMVLIFSNVVGYRIVCAFVLTIHFLIMLLYILFFMILISFFSNSNLEELEKMLHKQSSGDSEHR